MAQNVKQDFVKKLWPLIVIIIINGGITQRTHTKPIRATIHTNC